MKIHSRYWFGGVSGFRRDLQLESWKKGLFWVEKYYENIAHLTTHSQYNAVSKVKKYPGSPCIPAAYLTWTRTLPTKVITDLPEVATSIRWSIHTCMRWMEVGNLYDIPFVMQHLRGFGRPFHVGIAIGRWDTAFQEDAARWNGYWCKDPLWIECALQCLIGNKNPYAREQTRTHFWYVRFHTSFYPLSHLCLGCEIYGPSIFIKLRRSDHQDRTYRDASKTSEHFITYSSWSVLIGQS